MQCSKELVVVRCMGSHAIDKMAPLLNLLAGSCHVATLPVAGGSLASLYPNMLACECSAICKDM